MYIPDAFRVTETESLYSFIERYDFATIVSSSAAGIVASHVPVILDRQHAGGILRAHVARANRHWEAFNGRDESLTIFHGPHAYVSPSWYKSTPAVPTWNYAAVHVYGRPKVVQAAAEAQTLLAAMVAKYENHRATPWSMKGAPADFVARLVSAIVTFEIPIERIEGKFKLSQNKPLDDQRGVVEGLKSEPAAEATALAAFMRTFSGLGE